MPRVGHGFFALNFGWCGCQEQKAEIKEAFDLFDTDGTGTIEVVVSIGDFESSWAEISRFVYSL